jgi:hypothetical protein
MHFDESVYFPAAAPFVPILPRKNDHTGMIKEASPRNAPNHRNIPDKKPNSPNIVSPRCREMVPQCSLLHDMRPKMQKPVTDA